MNHPLGDTINMKTVTTVLTHYHGDMMDHYGDHVYLCATLSSLVHVMMSHQWSMYNLINIQKVDCIIPLDLSAVSLLWKNLQDFYPKFYGTDQWHLLQVLPSPFLEFCGTFLFYWHFQTLDRFILSWQVSAIHLWNTLPADILLSEQWLAYHNQVPCTVWLLLVMLYVC